MTTYLRRRVASSKLSDLSMYFLHTWAGLRSNAPGATLFRQIHSTHSSWFTTTLQSHPALRLPKYVIESFLACVSFTRAYRCIQSTLAHDTLLSRYQSLGKTRLGGSTQPGDVVFRLACTSLSQGRAKRSEPRQRLLLVLDEHDSPIAAHSNYL